MKKTVITLLAASALVTSNSRANDSFIEFAVNQAHQQGFYGCDAAIEEAFGSATGEDIRITRDWFKQLDGSLRMTGTYGSRGDSVFVDTVLTKSGGTCYAYQTTIIGYDKSCNATLAQLDVFEYVDESADYVWTKSEGGVDLLLSPVGDGCNAIFRQSFSY